MHDMSLGAPVDCGEYEGPTLKGKPLHKGNCEDGVYGCRMCNKALKYLTFEEQQSFDQEECRPKSEEDLKVMCSWCDKYTPHSEITGVRPWDEPSCYYEVCGSCHRNYRQSEQEEYDHTFGRRDEG